MEHSLSRAANRSSANEEISHLLWNPKALATCPYPDQTNSKTVHAFPSQFLKIQFSIILLSTPRSSKWPTHTPISTSSRHIAAKTCAVCLHLQHSPLIRITVTTLWAGQSWKRARFPVGIREFFLFFLKNPDRLWAHPDPHSINAGALSPLTKRLEREANYLHIYCRG
jgi:hypothetical protein